VDPAGEMDVPHTRLDPPPARMSIPPTQRDPRPEPEAETTVLLRLPVSLSDRFTVVRELPGGGEADVLVVRDTGGVEWLVKIYRSGYTADLEVIRRLAESPSDVLVCPEDHGHDEGRYWERMELLRHGSLADTGLRQLPPEVITEVVRQIHVALTILHGQGVVHGDLKPANVLVRGENPLRVAVADFGVSRYLGNASVRFTRPGHTIEYAAPEARAGAVAPAIDWWSLGMMVRELATGRRPFAGLDRQIIEFDVAVREIDVSEIVDERLRMLCSGLLVRRPDKRWTAEQVGSWLSGGSPDVHREASHGSQLRIAGQTYRGRGEVARAMAVHWDEAKNVYLTRIGTAGDPGAGWRMLGDWLARFDEDVEGRVHLVDHVLARTMPPDVRLMHLLLWLDPSMPPTYRGLRLCPDDVPAVASAAAEEADGVAGAVVNDLWRHRLLPVLAGFQGGATLVSIDEAWRRAEADLARRLKARGIPPAVRAAATRDIAGWRTVLLRAVTDPAAVETVSTQARAGRAALTRPPRWYPAEEDLGDLTQAMVALIAMAKAEDDQARWEERENVRKAGRLRAVGFAAAASGIAAALIALFTFLIANSDSTVLGAGGLVLWLTVSEIALGYWLGTDYHPRWSMLSAQTRTWRQLRRLRGLIARMVNRLRAWGSESPGALGCAVVLSAVACCFCTGYALVAVQNAALSGMAIAAAGHLVWTVVRAIGYHRTRARQWAELVNT